MKRVAARVWLVVALHLQYDIQEVKHTTQAAPDEKHSESD